MTLNSNFYNYLNYGDSKKDDWFYEINGDEMYLKDPAIMQKDSESLVFNEQLNSVPLNRRVNATDINLLEYTAQHYGRSEL